MKIIYKLLNLKLYNKCDIQLSGASKFIKSLKINMFLGHPNIAKLYHIKNDKNFIYCFYEPCLEHSLASKLKEDGPFS